MYTVDEYCLLSVYYMLINLPFSLPLRHRVLFVIESCCKAEAGPGNIEKCHPVGEPGGSVVSRIGFASGACVSTSLV